MVLELAGCDDAGIDTVGKNPVTELQLTEEQTRAVEFVCRELSRKYGIAVLAGPAGSGKTTILKRIGDELAKNDPVTFSAMTGKAAVVLRSKGIDAVTLHQACMKPLFKPPLDKLGKYFDECIAASAWGEQDDVIPSADLVEKYSFSELSAAGATAVKFGVCAGIRSLGIKDMFKYLDRWMPKAKADGILIVDEASMLSRQDFTTISAVFKRILLVGDKEQLGPIEKKDENNEPVFWDISNRFELTEIHRQAEGSQPLMIATTLRTGGTFSPERIEEIDVSKSRAGVPVIVWTNKTRVRLTEFIRAQLGYPPAPQAGEYLVCRNNSDKVAKNRGLVNNTLWKITAANGFCCTLENDEGTVLEDEYVYIDELDAGHGTPFRFAYALTAHNAQGSEWPEVMVHFGDAMGFCSWKPTEGRRWLYTAVTRASEKVIWINE